MTVRPVGVAFVLGIIAASVPAAQQAGRTLPVFDLLIRNAHVYDGMGNPWIRADVAIHEGRIHTIGRLATAASKKSLDADGLAVAPGFIDVHSHAGGGLATEALKHGQPVLAQGITTVIVNPDGGGPVDLHTQRATYTKQGIGLNVALMVPHGSIRREVMGMTDRDPSAAELARMVELVREGMRAGAIGLSSGLYYAPGSYSKTAEVVAMARAAAEAGGVYSSHIRDESDYSVGLLAAVQEVIDIAEQAGLIGIVTHVKALGPASHGLSMAIVERIEGARARGVQVYTDQYPYSASGTGITGALIPRWAQVAGRDALLRRIRGDEGKKILENVRVNIARRGGAETLVISRYSVDSSLEGRTLAELAKAAGATPEQHALDLLQKGEAGLVSFNMSERDIELLMRQPWTMTSTDGDLVPMGQGKPHPRAYGAFPRKLRLYVRERGTIDLSFAIRSMTSLPAQVFGLTDRGQIRPGAIADLVIFDPANVHDAATYQEPHRLAEGMTHIVVNGVLVRENGAFTDALPGRVLAPERR
ncbi:MAG TPA: amidohydrolase family protein [Vicinamibacterales bacterium]|nr:amidohydrolase family protein [Vicinamibacterales bacterium]